MQARIFRIPTYYGSCKEPRGKREYDAPNVAVLVHDAAGVRIVLGTDDPDAPEKPDLQIERRPGGWAVFINPEGIETCAVIYVLDDGRTFCVKEGHVRHPLQVVDDQPRELDQQPSGGNDASAEDKE